MVQISSRFSYAFKIFTAALLLFLQGSGLVASPTDAEVTSATLDTTKANYFRLYTGDSSLLLALRPDGSYQLYERNKYRNTQSDQGTWAAGKDGFVSITSDRYKDNVEVPPFSVVGITTETEAALVHVEAAVANFLHAMGGTTVTSNMFHQSVDRHMAQLKQKPEIRSSRKYRQGSESDLAKEEIEKLRSALQSAATGTTASTASLHLRQWKDIKFLERPGISGIHWTGFATHSAPQAAVDTFRRFGSKGRSVFVSIDENSFNQESKSLQDPLYVPDFSTTASAGAVTSGTSEFPDPATDPVGALTSYTKGFRHLSTSTTAELAGVYKHPGPSVRHGLSGYTLYLFPDGTYLYLNWADIMPRIITSRGTWSWQNGYIKIKPDGTLKNRMAFGVEQAYMPISFVLDKVYVKEPTTLTGLLGFPNGYEDFFKPDADSLRMTIFLLEYSEPIKPEDAGKLKEELMEKRWRPDYLNGVPGAQPPEW